MKRRFEYLTGSMKELFSNLLYAALDIVAPPRHTDQRISMLTIDTLHAIAAREKDPVYAPEIRTLLPYRNQSVKALIWEMKYRRNPRAFALAAEMLREELIGAGEETIGMPLLIPVPMHDARKRERGYNQTEVLCETIVASGNVAADHQSRALVRQTAGTPQQKLARAARLANMKGSMRADKSIVKGRVCIVLDDVSTTGATLLECKRALKKAGARAVYLLALAG